MHTFLASDASLEMIQKSAVHLKVLVVSAIGLGLRLQLFSLSGCLAIVVPLHPVEQTESNIGSQREGSRAVLLTIDGLSNGSRMEAYPRADNNADRAGLSRLTALFPNSPQGLDLASRGTRAERLAVFEVVSVTRRWRDKSCMNIWGYFD